MSLVSSVYLFFVRYQPQAKSTYVRICIYKLIPGFYHGAGIILLVKIFKKWSITLRHSLWYILNAVLLAQ